MFAELEDLFSQLIEAYARFFRRILGRSTIIDLVEDAFEVATGRSFTLVSERYQIGGSHKLPSSIRDQYSRCVATAATTFVQSLRKSDDEEMVVSQFERYFSSQTVASEMSKLLEPGVEEFDAKILSKAFFEELEQDVSNQFSMADVEEAWRDFQKAFSFSSRAMPDLREFIRASYEEGSFHALADIRDVVDKMRHDADSIFEQESELSGSMDDYEVELAGYKEWARSFSGGSDRKDLQ